METKNVIVVVLAYGVWGTNSRTPKEIVGYGMYLKQCADGIRHLEQCGYRVQVILSGGAVHEGITEADSMVEFFRSDGLNILPTLEKKSLSTPANVWQAFGIMNLQYYMLEKPATIFFCDKTREFKVRWLVWLCRIWQRLSKKRIIPYWARPEIIAFDRPDISPKSNRFYNFLEVMLMALWPPYLRSRINMLR